MRTRSVENDPIQRIQLRLSEAQLRTARIENQKVVTVPIYDDIANDPPVDSIEGQIALSRADLQVWWFSNQAWHTCGCSLDGFNASSDSELYKYGGTGRSSYDLCKGPDGQPWAAIVEGYGTDVGGGSYRGPFVYRWNGSSWTQVSYSGTTDGGIGDQQTIGQLTNEYMGDDGTAGVGNDKTIWGNTSYADANTGSHTTASYAAGSNIFSSLPVFAYICSDGTNIYALWHHQSYYRHRVPFTDAVPWYVRSTWRVRRYDGGSWTELGGPWNTHYADRSNTDPALDPVGSDGKKIVADSTGVYVFWRDADYNTSSTQKYYVSHWNGSSWVELGGGSIPGLDGYGVVYYDFKLDGSGHPTIIARGDYIGDTGPPYDKAHAFTFDGSSWHQDTFQISYPNFDLPPDDIPNNTYITLNDISMSPIRSSGDYVVGFQCNRDGYESYFATFKPSTRTWATFQNGAKLKGTNFSSGQVVGFKLVAPEGNKLWLVATHYGSGSPTSGPHFWVYLPQCKCWVEAVFVGGVDGPLTSQGDWSAPYRDGSALYLIEKLPGASGGPPSVIWYHEHVWHGTIGHGLDTGTPATTADPPTNDNFANAKTITGSSGQTTPIDINRATTEASEPSGSCLSFGPACQTVWFNWTAPASGSVTFDTESSSDACVGGNARPDTILTIWTGSSLGSLTEIACDDDSGIGFSSKVTFTANAGTTYRIQVGTAYLGAACDHLVLSWA